MLVLAHLRTGETLAALAAGFGVGTATARRYVTETVRRLAVRAPKLARRCTPRRRRRMALLSNAVPRRGA